MTSSLTVPLLLLLIAAVASYTTNSIPQKTLELTRNAQFDSTYPAFTKRCLSNELVALIAWWMEPLFYAETNLYRSYLRASDKSGYTESQTVWYSYATDILDKAESISVVEDDVLPLYRGISGGFAPVVLNSGVYSDNSFASTSYDITTGLGTFGTRDAGGYLNILALSKQRKENLLYINDIQREFLLPRGSRFNISYVEEITNLTVVSRGFTLYYGSNNPPNNNTAIFSNVRIIYLNSTLPVSFGPNTSTKCSVSPTPTPTPTPSGSMFRATIGAALFLFPFLGFLL